MSENEVEVPFGESNADNAILLLAAAEELELDPSVVRTSDSNFVVPQDVYDKAFPDGGPADGSADEDEDEADEEPAKPAKKTAAKKSAK